MLWQIAEEERVLGGRRGLELLELLQFLGSDWLAVSLFLFVELFGQILRLATEGQVLAIFQAGQRVLGLPLAELRKPQRLYLLLISMLGHIERQLHARGDFRNPLLGGIEFLRLLVELAPEVEVLVEEEDEVVPEELKIVDEVREEAVKMLFVGARLEESHPLEERVYGG